MKNKTGILSHAELEKMAFEAHKGNLPDPHEVRRLLETAQTYCALVLLALVETSPTGSLDNAKVHAFIKNLLAMK